MNSSEYLSTVFAMHDDARRRGMLFQSCEQTDSDGPMVRVGGRDVISFSSCSYLGLERHPALIAGVEEAVRRHGSQFSSSRGYLSAPPYAELEELLSELFGGFAMVTSSTTLGHQIALPVLATEQDAIVLDGQVHRSVQVAATLAQAQGATVETVRHWELERAVEVVERLARRHRTVYFACDGVYSMYGDLVPIPLLERILAAAPNVRLYVDDAHGMSWAGPNGRGSFLSRMPLSERVVVATSLNKAFAAAGGCLVFANAEERERVRLCGGSYVFSGPVQPPMLGAAVASARVHLSSEIGALQARYRDAVEHCSRALRAAGVRVLVENDSPIFFVPTAMPEAAVEVANRLNQAGIFLNVSMYPSVPMNRAGIRLTVTARHDRASLDRVAQELGRHLPEVLDAHGITREALDDLFERAVPPEAHQARVGERPADGRRLFRGFVAPTPLPAGWRVERHASIRGLDREEWNRMLGGAGACSWDALALSESVFAAQPRREDNWQHRYVVVRDERGEPRCATFFTLALQKGDMMMHPDVSLAAEERRRTDPYFLTEETLTMGSFLSEGNHLFLDRRPGWRDAMALMLDAAFEGLGESEAEMMVLRDLPSDDPEMDAYLRARGFLKVPLLSTHVLDLADEGEEAFLNRLSHRSRRFLRRCIAASAPYRRRVLGAHGEPLPAAADREHLYRLYRGVADRKLRINVFPMPEHLIDALLDSPAWEIVTLTLDPAAGGPADGAPVSWYAAHRHEGTYAAFLCGVDYRYVEGTEFGAYRQMLLQIVRRARELGMRRLHFGMDADQEKARFHTRLVPTAGYVYGREHDASDALHQLVVETGLARRPGPLAEPAGAPAAGADPIRRALTPTLEVA